MKTPAVGSLEHFRRWAAELILDTGEPWDVEPWELEFVRDLLAGWRENWLLVPEGNGKTTLLGGIALYHGDTTPSPFVPIGASSREQAEVMYRQAEGFVLRTPGMAERFKCQEGYRRIKCLETVGRIQVFAADDRTADGVIPTLALLDELHRHRDLRLYRTWNGKLEKRGGQLAAISTAGEPSSEFEETRARIIAEADDLQREGPYLRAAGRGIVLHDYAVRDRDQCEDMDAVAAANPRREITAEVLARKRESPTMTPAHWQRFVCNLAARLEGQGVTPEEWKELEELGLVPDLSVGRRWGFLDLGWKIDTTGLGVLVWESRDRRLIVSPKAFEPPVSELAVVNRILDLQDELSPEGWVYDPNAGGQQMAQLLERGEHPAQVERGAGPLVFIEHSQDNAPMALAAARLDEAMRQGWLVHDGDPVLRRHVFNAVRRELGGEKWKFDRPADAKGDKRRRYPIDLLTGVLMAHSIAVAECDTPERKPLMAFV